MKIIKVKSWSEVPVRFTGKTVWNDSAIRYFLNGKLHRLDGPAYITTNYKEYWINEKLICSSNIENYELYFYNSKEYKKAILLENIKKIKNII